MKRPLFFLCFALLLLPVALGVMQDTPTTRVEITGVNPADLPTIIVNAAVYDRLGQPVFGLTADNFAIKGPLAEQARIVSVENVTDDQLAFAVVLAIDTSSSMSGLPLDRAKEAATNFINSIGPNDPVAIVTFDSNIQLIQDYTTDKDVLNNAIASLGAGGRTALYKGVLEAVNKAAESPTPRRAVIVLSDGAEYGNISGVERGAAFDQAVIRGVPVYTIGLGFGIDRSYLQEISEGTNARFNESPAVDELLTIYNDLATTLRSQYIVTIQADVPGDGTEYGLTLEVTTPEGAASADTTVRVPIIVPIVTLPDLPTTPITEPVVVTADVRADDPLTTAQFRLDGVVAASFTEPPYTITLDPMRLRPGTHRLAFSATDESGGGVGQATGTFEVAALPSTVTVVGLGQQAIAEPLTITLDVTGQTPATGAAFSIDDGEATVVPEAPYNFTINPAALAPGEHTLSVDVTNAGGATANVSQPFTVAALPPEVTITGLENQPEISQPVEITVDATGQTPVSSVVVSINGQEVANTVDVPAAVTINPGELQPGQNVLTATVTLESGQATSATAEFTVAALPPQVTITGIQAGETLTENRTVTVEADSQTAITNVVFALDGQDVATEATAPYTFELDVLAISPGAHILSTTATNAGGQSASADVAFMISDAPSLTATASAMPSDTLVPTTTRTLVPTATLTVTVDTSATAAQQTLLGQQATGTADALAANAQATDVASQTLQAQTAEDNAATTAAQATSDAEAAAAATQTLQAQAAINSAAATSVRATQNADATANLRATADARATANALATLNVASTQNAQATRDAVAVQNADASATANAQATFNVQATINARATRVAQATQNAAVIATANSQATRDVLATRNAEATATGLIEAATQSAQETRDALATENAAASATANAQLTLDARATATANALATENAGASATANAQETLDADATLDAQETEELTEEPTEAAPTQEPTEVAQLVSSPTATESRADRTPVPTMTPIGTLTIETIPGTTATSTDILPIVLIIIIVIVVLIIIFLFLRGRRTRNG